MEWCRTPTARRASAGAAGSPGGGKDLDEWAKVEYAEALRTAALLLGLAQRRVVRRAVGPSRTGACADRLNSLPKYVVSSTLQDPAWTNVTVLKGNVVDEVTG